MARGNYAPRLTSCLHARAIVHDRVVGRPVIEPNGWPKGQKTVDDETVSGNCCRYPCYWGMLRSVQPTDQQKNLCIAWQFSSPQITRVHSSSTAMGKKRLDD